MFLAGCATNDFKVVDALAIGMSQERAEETIASYGFVREESLTRPKSGWPESSGNFTNLSGRANYVEKEKKIIIKDADYYPVYHGLLGFGQLFLFFDEDGSLVDFYRKQIN